jgi:lipopolysaccharide/colanic/teichoic acid biosynthesis glycosyltransferase
MRHSNDPNSLDGSRQARKCDARVTKVGRVLRRYSIDEVPQLFNVMKCEMSLVGPRPHALNTLVGDQRFDEVVENYEARHSVLPGITGWAQINGWRGETSIEEQIKQRVAHDLYYIENWSLGFDLRILLVTLREVVYSERAY